MHSNESQFISQLALDAAGMWRKKWLTQEIKKCENSFFFYSDAVNSLTLSISHLSQTFQNLKLAKTFVHYWPISGEKAMGQIWLILNGGGVAGCVGGWLAGFWS